MMPNNVPSSFVNIKRLWNHISIGRRKQFIWLLGLMVATSIVEVVGVGLLLPFLSILLNPETVFNNELAGPIIKILDLAEPQQLLLPVTIFFSITLLIAGLLRVALLWSQIRISHAVGADLSISIYSKTLYQPYSVHISRNSSEVIAAISQKTNHAVSNIVFPIFTIISSILMILLMLALLFMVNIELTLFLFTGLGLIYIVVMKTANKYLVSNGERVNIEQTRVIKILREGLGGIRDILIDGVQKIYSEQYKSADLPLRRSHANIQIIGGSPRFIIESLSVTAIVIFAFVLSSEENGLESALPALGTLVLGAQKSLPLLQQLYSSFTSIISGQPSLGESLGFLEQKIPKSITGNQTQDIILFNNNIQINNVEFSYQKKTPIILNNISLLISKGTRIGFIGSTGGGKSTLLDVIMGLLSPTKGTMTVDNIPITSKNDFMWRKHISHVPQAIFLSDATIKENIAFGSPFEKIDMARVQDAAETAQISKTIELWDEGYDTKVGERGIRLSGGQRQRIGIARALYKQADVIILDEATSALDNKTEAKVMEAIENIRDKVTVLIVAHRLTSLKNCTQIVELENGMIKNIGTYNEIVLKDGLNS
jgi:ATP-binding cassette, subfamily B, bacterial PglK